MLPAGKTPRVLLLSIWTLAAFTAPPTTAPAGDAQRPEFWLNRAAKEVAAAPAVEYDGLFPRLSAAEAAADLYRADPTPQRRQLLVDKIAATEEQLAIVTQPWRRWYGHLVLARVSRADLKDAAAYARHLAAAAAIGKFLPRPKEDAATYALLRGAELAAAGDAAALRKEAAAGASAVPAQLEWYVRVAERCAQIGLVKGVHAALDQLAADASVLPAGPEREAAHHLLAAASASVGEHAIAQEAIGTLESPRKFDAAVRLLRAARRDGRADVTKVARQAVAGMVPPTVGATAGEYVTELALAGDPAAAAEIGRDALERGPAGPPAPFYASIAAGLATAGDRQAAAAASERAAEAINARADPQSRNRVLLDLATTAAATGDWEAMNRHCDQAAEIADVPDAELNDGRGRLLDALLRQKRWDDAFRQVGRIRVPREREQWLPRVVAAQARAGVVDAAVASVRPVEGFVRAMCWQRIAIERARRGDVDGLAAWVDQLDTPLRRAAINLAVTQVLSNRPVRSTGFPLNEE